MEEALGYARKCMAEETAGGPYHEKLATIVTGCSGVLLSIQELSRDSENYSREGDERLEALVVGTETLAALKLNLTSHLVALNTITNKLNKYVDFHRLSLSWHFYSLLA